MARKSRKKHGDAKLAKPKPFTMFHMAGNTFLWRPAGLWFCTPHKRTTVLEDEVHSPASLESNQLSKVVRNKEFEITGTNMVFTTRNRRT